jgi:hypothetical protein
MRPATAAVLALLALAPAAAADEVRTKDGRVLEGKVLEDGADGVKLRLRFGGEITVARADVSSVVKKDLPEEDVAKKRAALGPADVEGRWKLALEAKERKVRKAFEELVDEVLRLDPAHAAANELRGNVLYDGKWMKPAERDRLAAEKEKGDKAKQGLVEHKGRWVTPEEKDALERGLVLKDGRWMTERDAKELEGLVEYKGAWVKKSEVESLRLRDAIADAAGVKLTVAQSELFSVVTVYNQADTNQVLADAERCYAEFATLYGFKPGERVFGAFGETRPDGKFIDDPMAREPRRCTIVLLEKEPQYQKFVDNYLKAGDDRRKAARPEMLDLWRRQKGFSTVDPDCWVVGYQFPFPKEQTRHTVVHKLSHVLLQRWNFKGTGWNNWWLVEGAGEMQEIAAFGSCQVFCVTAGYGERPPDSKTIGESWKAEAKRMVVTGGDRRLQDLVVMGLNDLEPLDLVKSWSFVHYLANLDPEKLRALTLLLKKRKGTTAEAFAAVYGSTLDQVDDRWREFVRKTY